MLGDQLGDPVRNALVDLDFHDHPLGGKHKRADLFRMQLQVSGPVANIRVECDAQANIVIAAHKGLAHIAGYARGPQVVLPHHGVNLFDHGPVPGGMMGYDSVIA